MDRESCVVENFDGRGRLLAEAFGNGEAPERDIESRLRLADCVFNNACEGICITDASECILEVNPTLCRMTGYQARELVGKTPRVFSSGLQDTAFYAAMWQTMAGSGQWSGELWNRRRDGSFLPVHLNLSAVRDAEGELTHYVGIMADVSETVSRIEALEKRVNTDHLTGLPNRLLLADRLRQSIAQSLRAGTLLAVCYLDLDGFKMINDSMDHEAGDELLVELSRRLLAAVREGDTVARIGGDEFVLLLWGLGRVEECAASLSRIVAEAARPVAVRDCTVAISASIGVALCPLNGVDPTELMACADVAMYRVKQSGGNGYRLLSVG